MKNDKYEIKYTGKYYTMAVPQTIDLAERAEMALNGMAGTIDPDVSFHPFFIINYAAKKPYMKHYSADPTIGPLFAEKIPMLRIMCGSKHHLDLESYQREEFVSQITDGLYWNVYDPAKPWQYSYNPIFDGDIKPENVANAAGNGIMLKALITWSQVDSHPRWKKMIREMVYGLRRIAVYKDDYAYYPDGGFGEPCNFTSKGWLNIEEAESETEGGEGSITSYQATQTDALMRWYSISGDEEALEVGTRLARYIIKRKFWGGTADLKAHIPGDKRNPGIAYPLPDSVCISGSEMGHWFSHGHARLATLRGILEYGLAANDEYAMEFVKRGYEFSQSLGIPRLGWVNCFPARANKMEACALGDLVALAIKLSDKGIGDYWDDVDSLVRNMLAEVQLLDKAVLEKVSNAAKNQIYDTENIAGAMFAVDKPFYRQVCYDDVINRTIGLFGSIYKPDSIPEPWIMQCCTSGAAEALYFAWEGIVREKGDSATINLLLNRASKGLDIDSYLPYEGKVVIHNKTMCRLAVRIPYWIDRSQLRVTTSGEYRVPDWTGNYLQIGGLLPGDKVMLQFPVKETNASYTVNSRTMDEQTYNCIFRGSTLVSISPKDDSATSYPLFLRNNMRQDTTPMKNVTRFVSDRSITRW